MRHMHSDYCAWRDQLASRQVCLLVTLTSMWWNSSTSKTDTVQLCSERAVTWPRFDGPFFPYVSILRVVKNRTWSQMWENLCWICHDIGLYSCFQNCLHFLS